MKRRSLILAILAIGCLVATATLTPGLSIAQTDKVKAAMADLKVKTEKLGVPKVEGKDLYFGTTKVDDLVQKRRRAGLSVLSMGLGVYESLAEAEEALASEGAVDGSDDPLVRPSNS